MAQNCIHYRIDEYQHPIGWETLETFRETEEGAVQRYERTVAAWPNSMLRLVEGRVLRQINPTHPKNKPLTFSSQ